MREKRAKRRPASLRLPAAGCKLRAFLLAAIVAALPTAANAANAAGGLEVEADFAIEEGREVVKIGEPFKFVVIAKHPPGGIALLPSPLDLGSAVEERASARQHLRSVEGDLEIDRYELELIAFDRGLVTIPSIPLALGATTAATAPMELTIESGFEGEELAAVSSTEAEAMQALETLVAQNPPPQAVMVDDWTLFWVLGAVLLLGLVLWAARVVAKRREAAKPAPPPPPPRPAHEIALEALTALRSAAHLERGDHKTFYSELSAILRAYAGGRWSFDSLDLTVDELIDILRARKTDGLDLEKMTHLLRLADEVKYAKFVPSPKDGEVLLDDAVGLVNATRTQQRPEAEA
ncbi:MAG: hypothetical protein RIT81_38725 [Deltaproteobacteria bacterium]